MKIPLRFQVTDFDCGTVSLLNAFSYLFDREEIPAGLVRAISIYTLDCYDAQGHIGQGGTSIEAIDGLARWITTFASENNFNVTCNHYENEMVTPELFREVANSNCVLFVRCWQTVEHYCIITKMTDTHAYFFDPYYFEEDYYDNDDCIEMIFDEPFCYNRKVKIERLFSTDNKDFSLCLSNNRRECVVIKKK